MKRRVKQTVVLLLIVTATAAITWTVRVRAAATEPAAQDPVVGYLGTPGDERADIAHHDPAFDQDLKRLRAAVEDARTTLAALLEKPDASDKAIRDQVEVVITANAALQRRVMEHVLAIRDHLTPVQQQRLLNLCAQGLRQGPGWDRARDGTGGMGWGPPDGNRGAGTGPGMGRGFRGGRGPTTKTIK